MRKISLVQVLIVLVLCSCMNKANSGSLTIGLEQRDSLCYPTGSISVDSTEVHICASEDGNMKFYSWNTGMGGTCPDYAVLCQFRNKDGEVKIEDFRVKEGEHHVALPERCPNGNQYFDHTLKLYLPARTALVLKQI